MQSIFVGRADKNEQNFQCHANLLLSVLGFKHAQVQCCLLNTRTSDKKITKHIHQALYAKVITKFTVNHSGIVALHFRHDFQLLLQAETRNVSQEYNVISHFHVAETKRSLATERKPSFHVSTLPSRACHCLYFSK